MLAALCLVSKPAPHNCQCCVDHMQPSLVMLHYSYRKPNLHMWYALAMLHAAPLITTDKHSVSADSHVFPVKPPHTLDGIHTFAVLQTHL